MAQPTSSGVHVDALLTGIADARIQSQQDFIASKVFPVVRVDKQTDKYAVYDKADWFRDEAKLRAEGTESAGSGYNMTLTNTYAADVWALHKDISDQTRSNTDQPMDPDRDATLFLTQRLLLRQEKQWVTDFFATSKWGTDSTPSTLWSDYTGSDPLADFQTGMTAVLQNTGFLPNTLVLGWDVWAQLRNHPDIIDRINGATTPGSPAVANQTALAQLIGVDRVLVAKATNNTAVEGETAVYAFAHGKNALLVHSSPSPGMLSPSGGYTFVWRGAGNGIGADIAIGNFRMEANKSDRIEAEMAFDFKVVGSDLGYFFSAAVA